MPQETLKEKIVAVLIFAALGVVMAGVLIEWLAGCGEHYIDVSGKVHQNQCIFIGDQNHAR